MKKLINKNTLFGFIIGVLMTSSVGVLAATLYYSNEVSYTPTDTTWNVDNVKDALDELYIDTNKEVVPVTFMCGNNGTTTYSKKFTFDSSKTYLLKIGFANSSNSVTAPYIKDTDGTITQTKYADNGVDYSIGKGKWFIIENASYITVYGVAKVANEGIILSGVRY